MANELFFIDNLNADNVFKVLDRVDFLYLFYINKAHEDFEEDGARVYLTSIAEEMNQPMPVISRGMDMLEKIYAKLREKFTIEELEKASEVMREAAKIARELNAE